MKDWIMELCPEIAEWQAELIEEQIQAKVAAEREACAAFLESGVDLAGLAGDPMMQAFTGKLLTGCAAAIRARGEK
jgi:hypothetical protein